MGQYQVSLGMLLLCVSLSLIALATAQAVPGYAPGLVPGSPAAAEWWNAQIAHAAQLAHHVDKRQSVLTPGNIPGLVPGSPEAADWWNAHNARKGHQAHSTDERQGRPLAVLQTVGNIPSNLSPMNSAEWQAGWNALMDEVAHYLVLQPEPGREGRVATTDMRKSGYRGVWLKLISKLSCFGWEEFLKYRFNPPAEAEDSE